MGILFSLIGIGIGIFILKYSTGILNLFGRDADAEHYLGSGGTYKFIKLFGVGIILFSLLYILGFFN